MEKNRQADSAAQFMKKLAEILIYFICLLEYILSVDAELSIPFNRMVALPPS